MMRVPLVRLHRITEEVSNRAISQHAGVALVIREAYLENV
jgi:hypothetical protein